ncbi:hypothetical protein BCR39DRAFT_554905 [Naematelia encephala]|uniref:RNA polymerase II elongation factor ELL N-terminal domain-containing protein n=1 Tax=Naematelia encephala TaxID=71784 RepID=A0A1Y2ADS0_9TREE|nr:hypothetical protein BCR39DRAFT_554905 [Naematelia encephala]
MVLPARDIGVRAGESSGSQSAFVVRFPEDVWGLLESSEGVTISMKDGMNLRIPGQEAIKLTSQPTGTPSELHTLTSGPSPSLAPIAIANARLTVPLTIASSSRAADKLKAQNAAFDKERKQRADRINGNGNGNGASAAPRTKAVEHLSAQQATPMARTQSSPAATQPMIPLKTRVIQLLALGPTTMDDMMHRVGATEEEVMRVVNVVGRKTSSLPDKYTLSANQYSKVKLAQWKYTYAERRTVATLARAAFDELGLPADAEERIELERKEAEGSGSGSSSSEERPPPPHTPEPQSHRLLSPAKHSKDKIQIPKSGGGGGLISKQKAKFAAEKRATSLPNVKEVLAGRDKDKDKEKPRVDKDRPKAKSKLGEVIQPKRSQTPDVGKKQKEKHTAGVEKNQNQNGAHTSDVGKNQKQNGKRKREDIQKRASPEKRKSPEYTSSSASSSDEERGRPRERKLSSTTTNIKTTKVKPVPVPAPVSRDTSSSSTTPAHVHAHVLPSRPRALDSPIPKRNPPPSPLSLSCSNSISKPEPEPEPEPEPRPRPEQQRQIPESEPRRPGSGSGSRPEPEPQQLRERYDELFPAYQLLTKRLAKVHAAAEGSGEPAGVGVEEVEKMVSKWEKWHNELAGIRRWFAEG